MKSILTIAIAIVALGFVADEANAQASSKNSPRLKQLLKRYPQADMNKDGVVNGLDVDPFVEAVVGGGAQAVPEPGTLGLLVLGGILPWLLVSRRRRR